LLFALPPDYLMVSTLFNYFLDCKIAGGRTASVFCLFAVPCCPPIRRKTAWFLCARTLTAAPTGAKRRRENICKATDMLVDLVEQARKSGIKAGHLFLFDS